MIQKNPYDLIFFEYLPDFYNRSIVEMKVDHRQMIVSSESDWSITTVSVLNAYNSEYKPFLALCELPIRPSRLPIDSKTFLQKIHCTICIFISVFVAQRNGFYDTIPDRDFAFKVHAGVDSEDVCAKYCGSVVDPYSSC